MSNTHSNLNISLSVIWNMFCLHSANGNILVTTTEQIVSIINYKKANRSNPHAIGSNISTK